MKRDNTEIIKLLFIIHLIASITCFIGVFLPYVSVINIDVSLKETFTKKEDYGYLILLIGAPVLGLILSLCRTPDWGILGAVTLVVERMSTKELWDGYDSISTEASAFEKLLYRAMIGKEAGYYCIIIGSIAMIISGLAATVLTSWSKE